MKTLITYHVHQKLDAQNTDSSSLLINDQNKLNPIFYNQNRSLSKSEIRLFNNSNKGLIKSESFNLDEKKCTETDKNSEHSDSNAHSNTSVVSVRSKYIP